jgi:Na+/melibiose symporter-like transporter
VNIFIGVAAAIPARRLLVERRDEGATRVLPDAVGVVLLALGVGLLSLGIVEGPDWGWGGDRVIGALGGGVVVLALFWLRSRTHTNPVIEPALFRIRSFSVASVSVFIFSFAFYGLLLANVLFLTQVWGYSVLTAGIALTPGPLTAALLAAIGGRLSDRYGQRVVAVPGGIVFGLGCLLFATVPGTEPHYWSHLFPIQLVIGAGIGMSFASLSSAAVAELPAARFSTGSAVSSGFRQIGAVLGVSTMIAVLGTPSPADALDAFRHVWLIMAAAGITSGLVAIGLGRVRAHDADLAPASGPAPRATAPSGSAA